MRFVGRVEPSRKNPIGQMGLKISQSSNWYLRRIHENKTSESFRLGAKSKNKCVCLLDARKFLFKLLKCPTRCIQLTKRVHVAMYTSINVCS